MRKIILAFSLLFLLTGHAQEQKVHQISLYNDKNIAIDTDFYIENVYDGRQVKENIGSVYVSMFNSKVSAVFQKPFEEEVRSLLNVLYPKSENKKAVSIRVNELYVTEANADSDSRAKKQKATATVVFDIIEIKEDGKQYITGTFFSTREYMGGDVTKKHPGLITDALKNSFENYKNTKQVYATLIPFSPEENLNAIGLKNGIKEGVYLNYKDVANGHSLSLADYTITKYKEGFCLLNKQTGRLESGFYGFSDGQNFHLNLFRFSTIKYYLKTEIMGDSYFIDEVYEQSLDFSAFNLSYGAMAALGGGIVPALILAGQEDDSEPKKIPLIIERKTGRPTFLTDKYVLNILEANDALRKEYKKTKRTPADKKMIYRKLIGV